MNNYECTSSTTPTLIIEAHNEAEAQREYAQLVGCFVRFVSVKYIGRAKVDDPFNRFTH